MGDFVHRGPEGSFVDRRRLVESADLPNELERGCADLILGDGRIEVEERSDVAAHAGPKVAERAARLRLSRKFYRIGPRFASSSRLRSMKSANCSRLRGERFRSFA